MARSAPPVPAWARPGAPRERGLRGGLLSRCRSYSHSGFARPRDSQTKTAPRQPNSRLLAPRSCARMGIAGHWSADPTGSVESTTHRRSPGGRARMAHRAEGRGRGEMSPRAGSASALGWGARCGFAPSWRQLQRADHSAPGRSGLLQLAHAQAPARHPGVLQRANRRAPAIRRRRPLE